MAKWILYAQLEGDVASDPDAYVVAVADSADEAATEIKQAITSKVPAVSDDSKARLGRMLEALSERGVRPERLSDEDPRGSRAEPSRPAFTDLD